MRKPLAAVFALAALLLAFAPLARPDELTPQKRADILRLFQASGSGLLVQQVTSSLTAQTVAVLRLTRKDLPPQKLAEAEREIRAVLTEKMGGPGGILDRMVPLYAATYTEAEIKDMLRFYESPTGRKVVASMPGLMASGRRIGLDMAREMTPELQRRLGKVLGPSGQKSAPAK